MCKSAEGMTGWRLRAAIVVLVALAATAGSARGDVFEWISAQGGVFADPRNWFDPGQQGRIPGRDDVARLGLAGSFEIVWRDPQQPPAYLRPGPLQVKRLLFADGDVAWNLGLQDVIAGAGSGHEFGLWVGEPGQGDAVLRVLSGSIQSVYATVGFAADAECRLLVAGPGSAIVSPPGRTSESLRVGGLGGTGLVELRDRAQGEWANVVLATDSESAGHLLVSGAETTLNLESMFRQIYVGYSGFGTARFEDGCAIRGDIHVGEFVDSRGAVLASGLGTTLSGSLFIGVEGSGEFEAREGVAIAGGRIAVGSADGGVGVARLLGSATFFGGDYAEVRGAFPSSLLIGDGAVVQLSGSLATAGTGTDLRLEGPGTKLSSRGFTIGATGAANTASVTAGARLENSNNTLRISNGSLRAADPGTLINTVSNVDASLLLIEAGAHFVCNGQFAASGAGGGTAFITVTDSGSLLQVNGPTLIGTLTPGVLSAQTSAIVLLEHLVADAAGVIDAPLHVVDWDSQPLVPGAVHAKQLTSSPTAILPDSVTLTDGGTITGISVVPAHLHILGGAVTPAITRPGMEVLGDLTMEPHATLLLSVFTIYENEYSRIDVAGAAAIGGDLRLLLEPNVSIEPDRHVFTVLRASNIAGEFGDITLNRPSGVRLQPEYTGAEVVLRAVEGMSIVAAPFIEHQEAVVEVTNAAPSTETWLYGTYRGLEQTWVEAVDSILELREPRVIAGPVRTDGAGRCEFRFLVMRTNPAQRFLSVQAAQFRDTSNVVRQRVQE